MRIMFISLAVVAGVTAYGFSDQKSSEEVVENAEQIIENLNYEQLDPMVTGISISKEHLAKWHERNRLNAQCKGCYELTQPYPGDEI